MQKLIIISLFYIATSALSSPIHSEVKEGYLLVRYKSGTGVVSINSAHAKAHAKTVKQFRYPVGLQLVKVDSGVADESSISVYKNDPNVLYAEPNYKIHVSKIPNDTFFGQQWGLNNMGQTGGSNDADINAAEAWNATTGNKDVVLGTIDTGVDYNHPDLVDNIWVNQNEIPNNGKDDDGNGYIDDIHGINVINGTGNPMDDHEHGTHVAGIIAARGNNAEGVSGVMQSASVAACKFLDADGSGDTAGAIECLNYYLALSKRAVNPVKIVATNNSWAGGPYSQALYDAIKANQDAGILFIAAASNEGNNNDTAETYPANFRLSNVISVAAVDHNDKLAYFSNYGRYSVHVAAPGLNILSTLPGGKYGLLSGTSMAAPFVTGLAGLIKSADPSRDWIQIKNLIIAGGQFTNGAYGKTISGRRIRASDITGEGSLTCRNQKVFTRLLPKTQTLSVKVGGTLPIQVMSINCNGGTKNASMVANGITLKDDGKGSDDVANDGIYNGFYKPTTRGTFRIQFSTNDIVTVQVL